jgi:putative ABC transport system permease protein
VSVLDLKLALRMLRRFPGLSLISVGGMAVAIAIAAGYFATFNAMLDSSLPFHRGDRAVSIINRNLAKVGDDHGASVRDFLTWRGEVESIQDLGAFREVTQNLILPNGAVEVVSVAAITAGGLAFPHVPPFLGRALLEADERPGGEAVVVIGYAEWQRLFGGSPDVVGQTLRLDGTLHTVVGVMPEAFRFPLRHQYWVPLRFTPAEYDAGGAAINAFGRLGEGISIAQAQAELTALSARVAAQNSTPAATWAQVLPYTHAFVGVQGPEMELALRGLQLLISLLLIVVAINVGVLIYARTATRTGEIAVRSALGATRRRIVMQLFVEATVLAGAAALIGLLIASRALGMINSAMHDTSDPLDGPVPFWIDVSLTPGVILYACLLALAASAIVGITPALKVTRRQSDALKEVGARGGGLQLGRTWTALIVAQVAIAVAVLPPALNYAEQSMRLGTRRPAAEAHGLLRATVVLPRYAGLPADAATDDAAFRARVASRTGDLLRSLESEPEFLGVTVAERFPGMEPGAVMEAEDASLLYTRPNRVAINLFDVFGVPIVAGRGFTTADTQTGAAAIIIDELFAQQLGGAADVIGRRVRYAASGDAAEAGEWFEVVGVVRSFAQNFNPPNSPFDAPAPRIFHPASVGDTNPSVLVVRIRDGTAETFGRRITQLAATVDPTLRVERVATVVNSWKQTQAASRFVALGILAVMLSVLLLSAAGIYAMISFTVTRRRREIGIRAALGADPARILAGVFSRAGAQLGAGVLAGLVVTGIVEWAAIGLPIGGRVTIVLPTVILVIVTVGLLAALGPARRGLAVQPSEVLREEI